MKLIDRLNVVEMHLDDYQRKNIIPEATTELEKLENYITACVNTLEYKKEKLDFLIREYELFLRGVKEVQRNCYVDDIKLFARKIVSGTLIEELHYNEILELLEEQTENKLYKKIYTYLSFKENDYVYVDSFIINLYDAIYYMY